MSTPALLLMALLARLLSVTGGLEPGLIWGTGPEPGWGSLWASALGLAVVPVAALRGAGAAAVCGLALLSLPRVLFPAPSDGPPPPGIHAVRLVGRWREPPGRDAYLETGAGSVTLRLADDLLPPDAGTPLTCLARLDERGRGTVVQFLEAGTPGGAWIDRWRAEASRRIRTLARAHRGLVEALLLGRRDDLSPSIRDDCIATGTMHLLALSGLHVALVAAAVLRMPGLGRFAHVASFATVLVFVVLAGGRPSLLRASLSWLGLSFGLAAGRLGPPLHRLAAVALVLAVVVPDLARDLGAQLSFLAVAGLLAAARLVRGGWLGPAGAFLATAPLCLEVFGRVQPWGLIVTPLLVPAVGAVLVSGLVAVFPGEWMAWLDPLTGPVLRGSADLLVRLLHTCAWWCPEPWTPPPFPVPGGLVSLAVVAALLALPAWDRRGATAHDAGPTGGPTGAVPGAVPGGRLAP